MQMFNFILLWNLWQIMLPGFEINAICNTCDICVIPSWKGQYRHDQQCIKLELQF